jgi:hypothetical protein
MMDRNMCALHVQLLRALLMRTALTGPEQQPGGRVVGK